MGDNEKRKLSKCVNCGKRIFLDHHGKYRLAVWHHYGAAKSECNGLLAKYATPVTESEES